MSSLNTKNQNNIDYLKILGLSCPPFSSIPGENPYYEESSSKHCLDQLLNLGRYSDHLLFVSGVLGGGKSTLLQQYITSSGEQVFTCVINADTSFDESKLEKRLTDGFGISVKFSSKVLLLSILQDRIESMSGKGKMVVLLVDNMQKLPKELHRYLRALAGIEDADGNKLLHIIMFGEPQLEEVVGGVFKTEIKILSLSQFSYEDTKKYIQFRLVHAGISEEHFDDMFNSVSMHNIHQLANGLPARINKLAYNRLIDVAGKMAPTEPLEKMKYLSSKQWITAVFVAAVIIAIWVYQDDVRQVFKNVENEIASIVTRSKSETIPAATGNVLKSDASKQTEQKTQGSTQDINKEDDGLSAEDRTLTGSDFVEELLAESEQAVNIADSGSEDEKQATSVRNRVVAQDQPVKPPTEITSAEIAAVQKEVSNAVKQQDRAVKQQERASGQIKKQEWLQEQDPDNYTIQVYGSGDNKDISKQFDKYQLGSRHKNVAWFQTVRKNKAWFSLVVGHYPDRASAREAVMQLPESMVKGAWVRSYRSIQADIKKVLPGRQLAGSPVSGSKLTHQQQDITRSDEIKREDWLLGQAGRQYTLQLLGTNKAADIARFIKQYQLVGDIAFYRTHKKGGQWFSLTYGIYPDRSTARAAVSRLPGKLQKGVWIRKLKSIHTDIQKSAN